MTNSTPSLITQDPWGKLRQFTDARIALGRAGVSLPLEEYLSFKLAHARARDAVHQPVIGPEEVAGAFLTSGKPVLQLQSMAENRMEYLTRPDKGRKLGEESRTLLAGSRKGDDVCIVLCDGLSAPAVNESGAAVANGFLDVIDRTTLSPAPVCLVRNGRVAIGDEIAHLLQAKMVIVLIGERPGLSSPNSLGAYITLKPTPGTTDEARNCISNIRKGGLSVDEAVRKIAYLVEEGLKQGATGIGLKDKMKEQYVPLLSFQLDL